MVRARCDWQACQPQVDPESLIFVDESGLKTNLTRRYGWALGGERLVEKVPAGPWETHTLVQAIDLSGTRAAMVLDGPLNGVSFTGFCEQWLAPTLQPGEIVILDNLATHKTSAAVAALEATGARVVYLPPYSPDLNPIELVFSKLKQFLRSAKPRTFSELISAARDALLRITPSDLDEFFNHCGYATT